jgi:DNA-binding NarL/FixJ family response regulator
MTPDTDVDPDEEARLAGVAYMEDDLRASRRHAEAAFRAYRDRGDLRSAARVAMTLAVLHDGALGNHAAGRGWLDRARRTLDRVGPCVEWGYLELAFMACDRPDIDELEASADRALTIALEFGDHDLEVCALADSGVALITQGRLREGLDRLDGAMAAISAGELADYSLAGRCFCSMLTGCDRAGDVNRVEEWMRVMRETMLEPNGGRPKVLATHCLVAYGSLLAATGRWTEAEEVMTESLAPTASRSFGHRVETTMNLARIRIEQGRIEDAQALIAPYEDHVLACEPIARVRLVAGDPGLASAAARRGLKEMKGDAVRGAALLARLVEAEIALGDLGAAADAADGLADLAARTEVDALAGEAELARGRVAAAAGDHAAATAHFERARERFGDRPYLAATARLALADSLSATGDSARAIDEARAAVAVFERLGAVPAVDRAAALLRQLGAPMRTRSADGQDRAVGELSVREREVLDLIRQGSTNAEIAARLYISPKTAEHHVSRILAKLGVRTRTEAAAVAAARSQ